MDIKKAKELLSQNKLSSLFDGVSLLPCEKVQVERFLIEGDFEQGQFAVILGLIGEDRHKQKVCYSYFVEFQNEYYYRENLFDALETVNALRKMHGFSPRMELPIEIYHH